MVFSSHLFLYTFLPLALLAYYAAPRSWRHAVLTLLSYLFYGWANPAFVLLMALSTVVDYACGLAIARARATAPDEPTAGRWAVTVSVVSNLALLGFFKYANFGIDSYNALVAAVGLEAWQWETFFRITLPVGISFYTFQSMSYSIDVYRGHAEPVRSFVDFACYVAMFPQLVAGPIVRFHEIADQLRHRVHSLERFGLGAAFFSLGLGKKVLLANPCGQVADAVFGAASITAPDAWLGVIAYAFQIYFDFSGYSDMAVGLGLFFGFQLPRNFDAPYRSESITEFWGRWHISLSRFLRDNLYIPLGGNRHGIRRTYLNLALVMLLGGLWHGAGWTFVVWGGIHGGMLAFERSLGKDSWYRHAPRPVRILITFLVTCLAWVFFRADTFDHAWSYLHAMIGLGAPTPSAALVSGLVLSPYSVLCLAISAAIVWLAPQTWDILDRLDGRRVVLCTVVLVAALAMLSTQSYNPFIYFQF